jgi:hypothetical protein
MGFVPTGHRPIKSRHFYQAVISMGFEPTGHRPNKSRHFYQAGDNLKNAPNNVERFKVPTVLMVMFNPFSARATFLSFEG